MADKYPEAEKRHFLRFPYSENVIYFRLPRDEHKISVIKSNICISKNLSTSGIIFTCKDRLELSDLIYLDFDYTKSPVANTIKRNILMQGGKPLGKVVRVEERMDGQYDIGVAFITEPEEVINEIGRLKGYAMWRRCANIFFKALLTLIIVYAALAANVVYLENKQTYNPDKNIYASPTNINIFYENVDIKTEDGQTINGWFIPAKDATITILYCPGREGNLSDELDRINFFHDMKVNLMFFDYRGYGKSSGKPSEQGFYKDALAVYDYLISRRDIDRDKIIVIGESLGGPVAINLCLKRNVKALVLESSLVSLVWRAQKLYPFLPVRILISEKYDALSKIKDVHIPKLFVHGIDDEKIPFDEALKLYYAAPSPKKFLPFRGAHNDSIFKISEAYKKELTEFIQNNNIL